MPARTAPAWPAITNSGLAMRLAIEHGQEKI
jgi:hypothetical protein